jgi:arylsulfatase A-like enzyme
MKAHPLLFTIIACGLLTSCGSIPVNRGPFDIPRNAERSQSKMEYLTRLEKEATRTGPPNILVILVDDLGKHDISVYDPEGVPAPNIQSLAENGVLFTEASSSSSVCSPSRAGLFTGRYQHRYGFERQPMNRYARNRLEYFIVDHFVNTDPMQLVQPMAKVPDEIIHDQGIPSSEILLSEALKHGGYKTGLCGKWHLGYTDPFKPNARGFDYHYGFYEAFSLYAPLESEGIIDYRHDYFANKHIWQQEREGTCAIRVNDTIIREEEYLTFSIAEQAIDFIDRCGKDPFFLVAAFSAPHTPFQVPVEYYNRFPEIKDENRRVYAGMIAALDDAVGQILGALEEQDLTKNTLIVFASDNGGATYTGATDNGPLKAGKFSQFEGGLNVPMIMQWTQQIPPGIEYTKPVTLLDVFSTSLAAAGLPLPNDRTIDGVDLIQYIHHPERIPHEVLCWRTDFNRAVRTTEWKLVWNFRDDQVFLYRISEDKGEKQNLASQFPDVVSELMNCYEIWEKEMKDPLWPGLMQFKFDIDGEVTWWAI